MWADQVRGASLVLLDGPSHQRLRAGIDHLWAKGGRAKVHLLAVDQVRRLAAEAPTGDLAGRVVRITVGALLGLDPEHEVVGLAAQVAPVLNAAVSDGVRISAGHLALLDLLCVELAHLSATNDYSGLVRVLVTNGVSVHEAVAATVFVLTAAVETIRALAQMCRLESAIGVERRRSVRSLLHYCTPVPYALYGCDSDISLPSGGSVFAEDLLVLSLHRPDSVSSGIRDYTFGLGSHVCFGARLAEAIGESLLASLPIQPISEARWNTAQFTWALDIDP